MSEAKILEVLDYDDKEGFITVSNYDGERVRIEVEDHETSSIVYPTIEQAQELVMNLLRAIHEAKHGSEESPYA